jgi:beta-phosphoglucomutase-like phosphatase (HAD superfamily)
MIDLDGTLINTDKLHFNAYQLSLKTLFNHNISYNDYNTILENDGIDNYIKNTFGTDNYEKIKFDKNKNLKRLTNS